jgi:hypothetical protein
MLMAELQRGEVLFVPKRRRLVHSKLRSSDGQDVLHVFYGEKEIIFDEPELLPFGDKLIATERFRAEDTMTWSDGTPYAWDKVRELLEALIEHEILMRVTDGAPAEATAHTFPVTLGIAAEGKEPRAFSAHHDQCPAITQEAFGHRLELGNLEALVPVYRVAHAALDQDGRQVGENNVTPRCLFLDLPTERRQCKYPGSRYQAELPMNITALRHMTRRWPELLSLTEQYRKAFFSRFVLPDAPLRIGDAHLLTVGCLGSLGYVMVRGVDPVPNGQLDAGLAAMFRLVDGVRLVTTELMRATAGEHGCERPISAQIVAEYAERHSVYLGEYGVCAGPQALIDEYLRVLLDGASAPIQAEPSLASRLGDLDAAIDYCLHGQRIEALIRSFGASQGLLRDQLRVALLDHTPRTQLQALLELPIDSEHYPLLRETHRLRDTFELELLVNRWLFERAGSALSAEARAGRDTIADALRFESSALASHQHQLQGLFARAIPSLAPPQRATLAAVTSEVFALERSCLRAIDGEQRGLHARLCRQPARPLSSRDLAVYTRPRTGPALDATLIEALDLSITTDATTSVVSYQDQSVTLQ